MKYDSFPPPVLTLQMFYLQEEMGWLYTFTHVFMYPQSNLKFT